MSNIDISELRHDFANNSLRLDILTKLIHEDLKNSIKPDEEKLTDLETFLKLAHDHLAIIQNLSF